VVRFTGGEPLLHPDIYNIMEYAKKIGLSVWINTNASLIDRSNFSVLVDLVDNIFIPFNSCVDSDSHPFTIEQKCSLIHRLHNGGMPMIRCGTIATKENIARFPTFAEIINSLPIQRWHWFREIPFSKDQISADNDDISSLVENLMTQNNLNPQIQTHITNALPFCSCTPEKVSQVAYGAIDDDGHDRFLIDAFGRVKPLYGFREIIGNALTDTMHDMWQSTFMRNMRQLKNVPQICTRCKYLYVCKGGSRLSAYNLYNDYGAIDYLARPEEHTHLFK
jgi:radical SAM protein with 4Fe4S-binding SPASM domain